MNSLTEIVRELSGSIDGHPAVCVPYSKRAAGELAERGYQHLRRFVPLPSAKSVRWVVPWGNRHDAQHALRFYAPYTLRGRIRKLLSTAAIAVQAPLPGQVVIASRSATPLETLVRAVTGEPDPILCFSLGTPGTFQKVTVQVTGCTGVPLGYIKLPLTPAAAARVQNEARWLDRLRRYPDLHGSVPRVLFAGELHGSYVLFQSPLAGEPARAAWLTHDRAFHTRLSAVQLVLRSGTAIAEEAEAKWRRQSTKLPADWDSLGTAALILAGHTLHDTLVSCGISHGDFTPWNTRMLRQQLQVFDWESATGDSPTQWDEFHFHTQTAVLVHRHTRSVSWPKNKTGFALFALYLLSSTCNLLIENPPDMSAALASRKSLLRQLMDRWQACLH